MTDLEILARAIALHEERNANAKRHGWSPRTFDGQERAFCLSEAKMRMEEEEYQAELLSEEIARMSVLSDLQIEKIIADIDEEYDSLMYRNGYHDGLRASLRKERHRYVKEQLRRSVASSTSLDAVGEREHMGVAAE